MYTEWATESTSKIGRWNEKLREENQCEQIVLMTPTPSLNNKITTIVLFLAVLCC